MFVKLSSTETMLGVKFSVSKSDARLGAADVSPARLENSKPGLIDYPFGLL